jgi:hypothetical protein
LRSDELARYGTVVVVVTPSANVTVTPANATGADNVDTSNIAFGADGLALRVAS